MGQNVNNPKNKKGQLQMRSVRYMGEKEGGKSNRRKGVPLGLSRKKKLYGINKPRNNRTKGKRSG